MKKKRAEKTTIPENETTIPYAKSPDINNYVAITTIFLFAIILYGNTINHGFVLDDFPVIAENNYVHKGIYGIPEILTTRYWQGYKPNITHGFYRPVSLVMFALEWHLFPNNPLPGHVMNVFLYAATGSLLFIVLSMLLQNASLRLIVPLFTSLLFIAHPVHTEVTANIKSRDEIMGFLFILISTLLLIKYLRSRSVSLIAMCYLSYFLALMSKESTITFLAVFPLILWFFTQIKGSGLLRIFAGFAATTALYFLVRWHVLGGAVLGKKHLLVLDNALAVSPDLSSRLASSALIMGKYLLLLIMPHPLYWDYSYRQITVTDWNDFRAILAILVYVGLIVYAIAKFKTKNITVFSILFYLITISIASNSLILIGTTMAERLLYVPSLGFCLALAILLAALLRTDTAVNSLSLSSCMRSNRLIFLIFLVVILSYSFKTITRNMDWKNNITLYSKGLSETRSARAHYNYGRETVKIFSTLKPDQWKIPENRSFLDHAIVELNTAIALFPEYADAYLNLGTAYVFKHEYDKALESFKKAQEYDPANADVYNNLGNLYALSDRLDEAMENFRLCIELEPSNNNAYRNLAKTYLLRKDYNNAVSTLRNGITASPENTSLRQMLDHVLNMTRN